MSIEEGQKRTHTEQQKKPLQSIYLSGCILINNLNTFTILRYKTRFILELVHKWQRHIPWLTRRLKVLNVITNISVTFSLFWVTACDLMTVIFSLVWPPVCYLPSVKITQPLKAWANVCPDVCSHSTSIIASLTALVPRHQGVRCVLGFVLHIQVPGARLKLHIHCVRPIRLVLYC